MKTESTRRTTVLWTVLFLNSCLHFDRLASTSPLFRSDAVWRGPAAARVPLEMREPAADHRVLREPRPAHLSLLWCSSCAADSPDWSHSDRGSYMCKQLLFLGDCVITVVCVFSVRTKWVLDFVRFSIYFTVVHFHCTFIWFTRRASVVFSHEARCASLDGWKLLFKLKPLD